MESICYGVGGIFDDSRSVSSSTTVLVSNRSKVTPETCSMADEVPHNGDEKDIDTIGTDPSHDVTGSHHQSISSGLTDFDDSVVLDADLQAEVQAEERAVMAALERNKQTKKKVIKEQRKRNIKAQKQAEHEDQKKPTKKRRDDEDEKDGNEGGGKPTAAAAAAAPPPAVSAK
jgi:hypothetical protein